MSKTLRLCAALLIGAIAIASLAIIQETGRYEERLHKTLVIALDQALQESASLTFSGNFTQNLIDDLMKYNCSPAGLRRAESERTMYYIYGLTGLADRVDGLRADLAIAYTSTGEKMPWELDLSLHDIGVFFRLLSQRVYQYMLDNRTLDCDTLPGEESLHRLNQAFTLLHRELEETVYNESYNFNGLDEDTVSLIYEASRDLMSKGAP
ncbi:MAG: hypothetical protein F7C38_05415 [Desulfurococcales archaeon]|nr:hypothetical protein [Desulfurococcales archaeon]